ncbi:MAG TPA: hypothetical protein EYH50_00895 [Pyrodictium delaneyi]|uniref:Peptidase M50 n=1 Tax=Pyrodictium delaneyi TaxID=1273541 RepID=A0A832ZS69_9CREN|nr:hypothetical protein [Pyrodictium delaneyi]
MALTLSDRPMYMDEWKALTIGALSVAFGFAGVGLLNVTISPISHYSGVLAGAVIGFIIHEFAHREVARRQGCVAGFVLTQLGLMLTVFSGILRSIHFPFAILAPGYVAIYCRGFARDDLVAAAGPASNIVLALASTITSSMLGYSSIAAFLAGFSAINAWLAFFNLLPFSPLDGSKIMQRNPAVWLVMIVVASLLAF